MRKLGTARAMKVRRHGGRSVTIESGSVGGKAVVVGEVTRGVLRSEEENRYSSTVRGGFAFGSRIGIISGIAARLHSHPRHPISRYRVSTTLGAQFRKRN